MQEHAVEALELRDLIERLRIAVREVYPGGLTPDEAAELVELFAEGERLCAAGKTMAARVVERSGVWSTEGHRTAAHWMAEKTGVAVGQAVGTLQIARRLEHLRRTTKLEGLGRMCRWHHYLKTHHGYRVEGPPGRWDKWVGPDPPS
ncbi:MAG TPA: hypothetical protein VHI97_06555 [Actinomycetota bacterium]|nr:hypothetical protein [Actinomycetota bacterium]